MSTRTRIAGVLVVVALVAAAATGTGLAASDGVQSVAQPNAPAVDTRQAQVQQQTQTQMQAEYCTYPNNATYDSFAVSNLSAPSGVEAGEPVTVSADITNPNDVPMIQCVEFRLEGDVVVRTGWALNPNETETIAFEVNTTGLEDGTYIHGIETRDFGELTTLTVGEQPEPEPEEPTASLQFDDQESDGSSVTVASANLSDGGYIAILDENGSVVGATDYLEPGEQENVSVPLLESLNESATLTAQAHLDTNDNQTLDFLTSNGTEDGPYTVNGTPVTDDAEVTVGEEPTPEEPTASLQFDDQESDGNSVTVASANLSDGGYIAVIDENGSVIGATDYLEPGEQENVSVPLLEPLNESATLTAQAHLDTNDNQTLDFLTSNGTEDGPYTVNGTPVTDDADVTVGEEPTTEEPTTEEPTTEEPTTEEPTTEEPTTEEPTTDEPTEEPTATVEFEDQNSDGATVTVASATLSEGGFVVIHNESGDVVGISNYIEESDSNIRIFLTESLSESATLTAMAHLDTNNNQQLDFLSSDGAEDGPYTMDGSPITDDAEITVGGEPTTEEPTTEEPTTEEPTTEEPTTEEPTTEEPTTEEPMTEEPTTEEPTNETETPPPTETPIDNGTEN
ncbi:hypothetical protein [Haloferax sp. Atlit-6N]|uniref:DUF7282 domain-containing protein n=1 Tax=Haloferax sp. Atlit-6N TaxID=2077205 RepID=UPI001F3E9014|nr:hypothetical protein [Haloferax sp. Atlit-6N]